MNSNGLSGQSANIRNLSRIFILIILLFTIITGPGCGGVVTADNFETLIRIPLGHSRNVLDITKPLFLGHRVTSFRLRVRFVSGTAGLEWFNGVSLSFSGGSHLEEIDSLPAINEDGEFWTQMIPGNKVWINIKSDGVVFYPGNSAPYFDIIEVEYFVDGDSAKQDVPDTNLANPEVLQIMGNYEVVGLSPRSGETQHYIYHTVSPFAQTASIYVSPYSPLKKNEVGLSVDVSFDGFQDYSDDDWIQPEEGDSGVYYEFVVPPNTPYVYVTVKTDLATPYFLNYRNVRKVFRGIIMERDSNIGTPDGSDLEVIAGRAGLVRPYAKQLSEFLLANPSVNQRINEVMVIASARLLNATDGHFRYGSAVLNNQIDWWRDVDVQFAAGEGVANTSWLKISLFEENQLQNPVEGGRVFVHEWSHWDFGMPDEYKFEPSSSGEQIQVTLDPNSIMGSALPYEYCSNLNHIPEMGLSGNSMWSKLANQYSVSMPDNGGGQRQAAYMDVLHKLDDLFMLTIP